MSPERGISDWLFFAEGPHLKCTFKGVDFSSQILNSMKILHMIAFILLVVGGLNWLLVAFGYNLVEMILGTGTLSMLVYILVGLSAIFEVVMHKKQCKVCGSAGGMM